MDEYMLDRPESLRSGKKVYKYLSSFQDHVNGFEKKIQMLKLD